MRRPTTPRTTHKDFIFRDFPSSEFQMRSGRSARLYFITPPVRLPFFAAKLITFLSPSKVAAGSAAAGTPAPEASETSASATVIAITAATSSSAAHDVCEEEENQTDVAGLDEEEKYQNDNRATKHNLREAKVDRLLLGLTAILVDWQGESDASVGGDDLGDLTDAQRNSRVVVPLGGGRHHGAANVAYLGVVQNALEA